MVFKGSNLKSVAPWFFVLFGLSGLASTSHALELDWAGQFRVENHSVFGYPLDFSKSMPDASRLDPTGASLGGYYVPPGGAKHANFQTLFFRLQPTVVVNDNLYIKSEWWAGDPVFGLFGNGTPYSADQRQWLSSFSRGSPISMQRIWADIVTDIGVVQVGRAPAHWGLGLFYNEGAGLYDRYMSTIDVVRMVTKFGAFSITPSLAHISAGNTIGGACFVAGACSTQNGRADVYDLSLSFRYTGRNDDFDAGAIYVKRIAPTAQDPTSGYLGVGSLTATSQTAGPFNLNVWDLYARKKLGWFTFGVEVPIIAGQVSGIKYTAFGGAAEAKVTIKEAWEIYSKAGFAPGQPNFTGAVPETFRAFYFHPNYRMGMIMFNYQLASFGGPQTMNNGTLSQASLSSPFYNPIGNAIYGMLGGAWTISRFRIHTDFIVASAQFAARAGENFYNQWEKRFVLANDNQAKYLGFESDWGVTYKWDERFDLHWDMGLWVPGAFYKFSNNAAVPNRTLPVFANQIGLGIKF